MGVTPNVELNIEELLLHGFPPGSRDAIAEAVRQELARRLAESGTPASFLQNRVIGKVDGGAIQVAPGAQPQAIGSQIAGALYMGLTQGK